MAEGVTLFKCQMCGGELNIEHGKSVTICEYCGSTQTLPKLNDEKRIQLYDRANHFRLANEFDKAMGVYEMILSDNEDDSEAYWGIVLCRYGIAYVDDPASHRRMPTVNRAQFVSIFDDADYKSAIKYADDEQKAIHKAEAAEIDAIQRKYLEISSEEDPFDVFICYKETDENGQRTQDSVRAYDIYNALDKEGFKVFFARVTLEDKLGSAYEPYIFAALHSAKVMIVVGTKREYFDAVWVKNEWSRFLGLIKEGKEKIVIPAYEGMSPYDMPEEFQLLQSQDMSKIGYTQDIVRGVKKLVDKSVPKKPEPNRIVNGVNIDTVLTRAFIFIEDKKWVNAKAYIEKVLDVDPENAKAYLGLLMIELKVPRQELLSNCEKPFDNLPAYTKAFRYADRGLRNLLQSYIKAIKERIRLKECEEIYKQALHLENGQYNDKMNECSNLQSAAAKYKSIAGYKDADQRLEVLENKIKKLLEELDTKKKLRKKIIRIAIVAVCVIFVAFQLITKAIIPAQKYREAAKCLESKDYVGAVVLYAELGHYKDSLTLLKEANYLYGMDQMSKKDYKGAYNTFESIQGYKESRDNKVVCGYIYAQNLLKQGDYENALVVLNDIGVYKDSQSLKAKCLTEGTQYFYEKKNYAKVIEWYQQCAEFDAGADFYIEACYYQGISLQESGQFENAIEYFNKAGSYGDAYAKINEAKYAYVTYNRDRTNAKTYEFLNDLVSMGYKDSGTIYNDLYDWNIEVFAINTSAKDEQSNRVSLSVYDSVYFHFKVNGGYPGEKINVSLVATYPNGTTSEMETKEFHDGYVGYYGWASGIYTVPAYGERGPLKLQFYANGEVIGEATVSMKT